MRISRFLIAAGAVVLMTGLADAATKSKKQPATAPQRSDVG